MQMNRLILLAGTLGIALMASACNPVTPSRVTTSQIRVRKQMITKTIDADRVDNNSVGVLSEDILQNGNTDVSLTIPYMRGHYAAAVRLGKAYKRAFAAAGVTHFSVAPVVVGDLQDTRHAVLSYQGLVALPPASCTSLPGQNGGVSLPDSESYRYDCMTQTELSKMIADPSDLLGRQPRTQFDSRRNGQMIDPYMKGTQNKPIQGYNASGL